MNNSMWIYGGAQIGVSQLTPEVPNERGDKQGIQWGLQTSAVYTLFGNEWSLNTTLSWFNLIYESEFVSGRKYNIETRSFELRGFSFMETTSPLVHWTKASTCLGEEILLGPTAEENVDNELTTDKIVGFNTFYEIPSGRYKIRTGFHAHYLLDTNEGAFVLLFSIEFGGQFFNNEKEVVINDDRFKEAPSSNFNLEAELINFETGTAELDENSREFLNSLGSNSKRLH